jgi:hypothetical protein
MLYPAELRARNTGGLRGVVVILQGGFVSVDRSVMRWPMKRALSIALLTVLTTGCAQREGYPSLSPRAVELADRAPAAVPATPATLTSDAARLLRLEEAARSAEASVAGFEEALTRAKAAVSSASGKGSESWIVAQMAVSRLEAVRGATGSALALIDEERKAMIATGPSADAAALDAAHTRASIVDSAQEAEVRALIAQLGGY